MHAKAIRWILFVAFAFTVPVLWFVLAAAGFIPLVAIFLGLLSGLRVFDLFCIATFGINLVLWAALLYFIAGLCARAIERVSENWRLPLVGVVLLALSILPFLPIYCIGDVGGYYSGGVNLYQLLFKSHFM